jgi:hypothetical protein
VIYAGEKLMTFTIIEGDALKKLEDIEDDSIDKKGLVRFRNL